MDKVLSDDQRALAEQYHGIIEIFIRKNRIDFSNYYDILAIGFCNGIVKWDESQSKKKAASTLPAFLYRHLGYCWQRVQRDERLIRSKANQNCLSLDTEVSGPYTQRCHKDLLVSDGPDTADMICGSPCALLDEMQRKFQNKKDKELLSLLAEGMNVSQIAAKWKVSRQCVHSRLKKIRKRLEYMPH